MILSRRFQCDAAGVGSWYCPLFHGFPLAPLGYHPRLRMVRLLRRRLCVDADAEEVQWVRVSTKAYIL